MPQDSIPRASPRHKFLKHAGVNVIQQVPKSEFPDKENFSEEEDGGTDPLDVDEKVQGNKNQIKDRGCGRFLCS